MYSGWSHALPLQLNQEAPGAFPGPTRRTKLAFVKRNICTATEYKLRTIHKAYTSKPRERNLGGGNGGDRFNTPCMW